MLGMLDESTVEQHGEIRVERDPNDDDEDDEDDEDVPSPLDNDPVVAQRSAAGDGPLPAGFGQNTASVGGSTLTEFTKRRNWAQRVVEELKDFLHILTPDGRIVYIAPSSKQLTGFSPEELEGKFIVDYIHPDDSGIFVREFNESIATGHPLRFFYRFRRASGEYMIFESHGHPHFTTDPSPFSQSGAAGVCGGFFMMARPYPTKNAALLDSFLEHKIENERLRKKIDALRQEEEDDANEYARQMYKQQEGGSDLQVSEDADVAASSQVDLQNPDLLAMPPPAKPQGMNAALTTQNLEDATARSKPDSIDDKMKRYEGTTNRYETIEMYTGLRYAEGERSQGISTGDASPTLIRGDAGIVMPIDRDGRDNKKKKLKVADEFVCTDCGTLDSPEWRKGPSGPKTLCNACGLRWAKKEKKRFGPSPLGGNPTVLVSAPCPPSQNDKQLIAE